MTDQRAELLPNARAALDDDSSELVREPSNAELNPAAHARRLRGFELVLGVAVPALLLLLWEVAANRGWIDKRSFPPPSRVAEKAWHMITNSGTVTLNGQQIDDGRIYGIFGNPPPTFWDLVWITTKRIVLGFASGMVLGLVFGILMGTSRFVRAALEPMFNALYTVPKLTLTPVFFAIWGLSSELPLYAVAAITTFFFIWISTMSAVMSVSEGYTEAARSFQLNRRKMLRHVIWPASLPQIMVGMRIGSGVTVLVVLSAELLLGANGSGIGTMIANSKDLALNDQMYVGIVVSAVMGVVFTGAVTWITKKLVPWAPKGRTIRMM